MTRGERKHLSRVTSTPSKRPGVRIIVPQLLCCGTWVDWPFHGHDTTCPDCHSTFTVDAS